MSVTKQVDVEELCRLYVQEQMSCMAIAKSIGGISDFLVWRRLKAAGVIIRDYSVANKIVQRKHRGYRRVLLASGYVVLTIPGHRLAGKSGLVYEHRLVWEESHGMPLPKGWVVHHMNGNRADNRPENLCGMPRGRHTKREESFVFRARISQLEDQVKALQKRVFLLEAGQAVMDVVIGGASSEKQQTSENNSCGHSASV